MPLRIKFALLIGTLLLAVVASLGAAWWANAVVRREISIPFEQATRALEILGQIKRNTEERSNLAYGLSDAEDPPLGVRSDRSGLRPLELTLDVLEKLRTAEAAAAGFAAEMESDRRLISRVGSATWRNLRSRLKEAETLAQNWSHAAPGEVQQEPRAALSRALYDIHELIEKTELRLLADSKDALAYSARVRWQLGLWMGSVFLVALLGSVLAITLLHRWVQRPVSDLREAAARIAGGDLRHRVPVRTSDELGQLSAEVNHMAEMVSAMQDERVERERLAAIGAVARRLAHNVRNPLSGIRGLAEVTRLDTPQGSDARENLDMIISTVDTFERWLTELIESSSPTKVTPVQTQIEPWLRGVVEAHRPMAQSRGIELNLHAAEAPSAGVFDPRHMDHAVAAVLSNAVEASPRGGVVTVTGGTTEDGQRCSIEVSDQGAGVPESVQHRIFDPDFTTKPRGTGIGLATAQQVLKSHGGSITLLQAQHRVSEAPEASGTVFRIEFPLRTSVER